MNSRIIHDSAYYANQEDIYRLACNRAIEHQDYDAATIADARANYAAGKLAESNGHPAPFINGHVNPAILGQR